MIPDVSVIVPTHRREALVVRAVESALIQQGVCVEVIVLDDTPEGSARGAIEGLGDGRVSYVLRRTPSLGRPALGRNEGIATARGRFLHFLDDDDMLHAGALACLLAPIDRPGAAGMSFGRVDVFGDDGEVVESARWHYEQAARSARSCVGSRHKLARQILFGAAPFITSACLVHAEHARRLGGFDTSLSVAEDYEFFLRVARACGAVFVDRPVLRHRTGLPSLSRNVDPKVWHSAYASIYRSYRSRFGSMEFYALRAWARAERAWSRGRHGIRRPQGVA